MENTAQGSGNQVNVFKIETSYCKMKSGLKDKLPKKDNRLEAIRDAHSVADQSSHTYRMEDYLEVIY